jgi:transposase
MAWTEITRPKYRREGLRYASDTTDEEWAVIARHMPPDPRRGRPRRTALREVVNAIFYIAQSCCQWRLLPKSFPPFTTVQHYFYAKLHPHQDFKDQTIWSVFEAERPKLVRYAGRFDGFHATPAAVSKTCLVRFDSNKYSVMAKAVGRPVDVHAYADRIVIRQDGEIVGEHPRRFGRDQTIYDPWHYVPVLARKPGGCATAPPSRTGCYRAAWAGCAAGSPPPRTATGRWSTSWPPS